MKNLVLVLAVSLAAGCGGKKKADGSDEAMPKMSEFRDKMCGCKDAECAQRVSDEMTKWGQEQAANAKGPPKLSNEAQQKATAIGTQMGECMQKAIGTGGGAAAGSDAGSAAAGSAMVGSAAAGSPAGSGGDGLPPPPVPHLGLPPPPEPR